VPSRSIFGDHASCKKKASFDQELPLATTLEQNYILSHCIHTSFWKSCLQLQSI
jgi:hypothetical protein